MYKYRISKYDPKYRDENGIYHREDWTSYSDIGKKYNGKEFSKDDYIKTEIHYCNTILNILKINEVREVILEDVELYFSVDEIKQMLRNKELDFSKREELAINSLKNGNRIGIHELKLYLRLILRECFWCRLIGVPSLIQVGFGYDYYVYLYSESIISTDIVENYKKEEMFIEKMDNG